MSETSVRLNKIYTRTGDNGETYLVGGVRVLKSSLRVSAYGEVDELNSWLGRIRCQISQDSILTEYASDLSQIQNDLFDIGAALATADSKVPKAVTLPSASKLEQMIDKVQENLEPLSSFVLPGGGQLSCDFHIARTVCRRAERSIVALSQVENVLADCLLYINRLSDLLFVLSRLASKSVGENELLWKPGS